MKCKSTFYVFALLSAFAINALTLFAAQQSTYLFRLNLLRPAAYATPGGSVGFNGSLYSIGSAPAYINDVTVSLNAPFTLVKGPIFQAPPENRVIDSGGSTPTLSWFTVNVGSNAAPGTYTGTATILGGRGPSALGVLTVRSFQIIVTAEPLPPAGTQVFYDDFENGSATRWTPVTGIWQVFNPPDNSVEYGAINDANEAVALAGNDLINYSVETWVNAASNVSGGVCLLARVQDANRFYQLELKPDDDGTLKWWLWRNNGGDWTHLKSSPFNYGANTYYKLRLTVYQQSLIASYSIDGENFILLGDAVDDAFAAGKIGLRRWGTAGTFDVVRVVIH